MHTPGNTVTKRDPWSRRGARRARSRERVSTQRSPGWPGGAPRGGRYRRPIATPRALALLACLALTACGAAPAAPGPSATGAAIPTTASDAAATTGAVTTDPAATTGPVAPSVGASPGLLSGPAGATCVEGVWTCDQQSRFAAVTAYARRAVGPHGYLSVVFTDRVTGSVWRAGDTARPGWTASTIKLAIAADLLRRDRAGRIRLRDADRRDLATMLNFSDEAASDRLWKAYGDDAMLARFRADFGMAGLHFVPGFTPTTYWGFVKCTADDLAALLHHVLVAAHPDDRAYLVAALRGVAPNQRWGVWAAGAAQRPGNKDGWSFESDAWGEHWVTDTVGFAGPGERYAVAVMYQVEPAGSLAHGVHTVSDVTALLFGAPVPAEIRIPAPDG